MIYILIVMWMGANRQAAISVEFNDLPSCRAAAAEIKRQDSPDVVLCAQKGKP